MITNLVVCLMSVVTNFTPVKAWTYEDVDKPCFEEINGTIRWNCHEETLYRPVVTTNFTFVGTISSPAPQYHVENILWTKEYTDRAHLLWSEAFGGIREIRKTEDD